MIMENFQKRGTEVSVMLITIPGSSCYGVGFKMAAIERFLFNVKYFPDMAKVNPESKDDGGSDEGTPADAWESLLLL